jgi:diadenosine tetraphosphate (Ap4A) HIT family hydrolase/SAM-dependent methyltransferase
LADVQVLPGWCILLADPVVPGLNELDDARRAEFLRDMTRLGDALLQVTSAERINYEILGNSEPELHAHVIPRYATEPPERRRLPAWFYDWDAAPRYDAETHAELRGALRAALLGDVDCASDALEAVDRIEQMDAGSADGIDQEMVRYYSARADEYDDWYLRRGRYSHGVTNDGAWKADLDAAAGWLDALPLGRRIAEIAAGTGWWSPSLARKGELTLYDAAPEPLAKAAVRLADAGLKAQIQVQDAWTEPDQIVDGVFTGFWLSHIDRARLDDFLGLVGRWLAPGGLFAFIDSRQDSESGAVDHRPPEADVQVRKLDDGTSFSVRKVFYEPVDLAAALARTGFTDIEVSTTDRFFVLGSARRRA